MRLALPATLLASVALAPAVDAQPAAPAGRAGDPVTWTFSVSLQGAYESNVGYGVTVENGGNLGDYLTRAYATLARRYTGPRSRFGLSLDGGGAVYQDVTALNNATWGARVAGGYDFTRRLSGDIQVASSLGYLRDIARIDVSAALPPYTLTRYDDGSATLRYLAAPSTTLHLDARGRRYDFQDTSILTNGQDIVISGGVDHLYRSGSRLSGIAEYERTSYGPTFEVARLSGRWRQSLARGLTSELQAGAAAYRGVAAGQAAELPGSVDPTELRFAPILQATIDGVHGRHEVKVSASRNVGQTYGFGTVGTIVNLTASYTFGPFHDLWFVANADASRTSGAPVDVPPDGIRLGSTLRWEAARRLRFMLDAYRWNRRGGTPLAHTTNWDGWAVSLSMASDWNWR